MAASVVVNGDGISHQSKKRKLSLREEVDARTDVVLDGTGLTLKDVYHCVKHKTFKVSADNGAMQEVAANEDYLRKKVSEGCIIYGVNTGYGGSADVRSSDLVAVQRGLVSHLNAGFGRKFDSEIPRAVMMIRANSLLRARSGVRPEVVKLLVDMLNHDVIPVVPLRGSVSASGDLMPTSYIAAAMMAAPNAQVMYSGQLMPAAEALKKAGLEPVTFQAKEALGVVNASSFASSLGALVIYEAEKCFQLTQLTTALAVEALKGRLESFHPIMHECMPHPGQSHVAANITSLLQASKMAITDLEINRADHEGELKQDRYALRTSPQWLGPVHETLKESGRRLLVELNSTNDNPVIDHVNQCILHGGNFQGTSSTVALDQARQSIQLCGKLLFAQISEVVNPSMNQGLPPNLAGSDISVDFGFKGMDTATASYMAELDWLTPPLSNHVLSAEIGNQAVNSMALVSARKSQEALEILCMILANAITAFTQAIDLRWLQGQISQQMAALVKQFQIDSRLVPAQLWPWYQFAFNPENTVKGFLDKLDNGINREDFATAVTKDVSSVVESLHSGACQEEIKSQLGQGTKQLYCFVREELGVRFYDGQRTLDTDLQRVYDAIRDHRIDALLERLFPEHKL